MIKVEVACAETAWGCPECGQRMHVHGRERRRWRHLDRFFELSCGIFH